MAFNYLTCKRQAALALAQLKGTDAATLEAAYSGAWALALDGSEIPRSAFKDRFLMIEKEIAVTIGNNLSHPARSFLYGRSVDLAPLTNTPTVDNTGKEFVGQFDSLNDSASGLPLTVQPPEILEDLSNSFFADTQFLNQAPFGNQVQQTVPLAFYQGCVWDYDIQSAAYDADGDSPLPQVCASILTNGLCGASVQVGWTDGVNAAGVYEQMYQQGLQLLAGSNMVPLASQNVIAG